MRCASFFAATVAALELVAAPAMAGADIGGLAMCSSLKALPKGAHTKSGCSGKSGMQNCEFVLASNRDLITYRAEREKIVSKMVLLARGKAGPFGLTTFDTPASAKRKLKSGAGLDMTLFDDPELFLQSKDIGCVGNVYKAFIYFDGQKHAKEVVVSSLPAI